EQGGAKGVEGPWIVEPVNGAVPREDVVHRHRALGPDQATERPAGDGVKDRLTGGVEGGLQCEVQTGAIDRIASFLDLIVAVVGEGGVVAVITFQPAPQA